MAVSVSSIGAGDAPVKFNGTNQTVTSILLISLGWLLLMIPVGLNGSPTIFADSPAYYSQGKEVFSRIFQSRTNADASSKDLPSLDSRQADRLVASTTIGARSVYYGVILYALGSIGTLWLVAAAQSLIGVALIWRTCILLVPGAWLTCYLGSVCIVAAGTTLPLYAGFAMPDVFSGYGILSTALLAVFWKTCTVSTRVGLALLTVVAAVVHMSHLAVEAAMLALGALCWLVLRGRSRLSPVGLIAIAACVFTAISANVLFNFAASRSFGRPIYSPPFLIARTIEDGPGKKYLGLVCMENPEQIELCRYPGARTADTFDFLWSGDPAKGVYSVADYDSRMRILNEQWQFLLGVVRTFPKEQLGASVRNAFRELTSLDTLEVLVDPQRYLNWANLRSPAVKELQVYRLGPEGVLRFSSASLDPIYRLILLTSALVLVIIFFVSRMKSINLEPFNVFATWIVAGLLANSVLCAVLSGPFARYQARAVWLIPFLATLGIVLFVRSGWSEPLGSSSNGETHDDI
jgi:hypothetical protein